MTFDAIKDSIQDYYSKKIREHGANHQGVDWNSRESQELRFHQFLRGFQPDSPFSVNDLGCGYGALAGYLTGQSLDFTYTGYDLSDSMIQAAKRLFEGKSNIRFRLGDQLEPADYSVSSGIFNVRLENTNEQWREYILSCLHAMDQASQRGFCFNILTSYSDLPYRKEYLYYGDPCFFFDYCKRNFSRNVALFHDYDLYEFTIAVKKDPP
jgi:SAM-dependent methyltransferase